MASSALAQEKVWVDKASYDKAECVYQEKLAKVQPSKIVDDNICKPTPIENQASMAPNTVPKSKSKKTKDNKLIAQENVAEPAKASETTKNSKNSKKNKKKEENASECVKVNETTNNVSVKSEDSSVNSETVSNKKSKAKEKKAKSEKKNKNSEEEKNLIEESKEQLNNQGSQPSVCSISPAGGSLANEVAKARQHIKQSLQCMDGIAALAGVSSNDVVSRLVAVEKENQELRNIVQELRSTVAKLDNRVKTLEGQNKSGAAAPSAPAPAAPAKAPAKEEADDEDVDLFGSDSEGEDAEAAKIREERLAAYAAKKSKKPALIAKSNIILDIKPWDDETDMKAMEAKVREIKTDGLLWGAAKLAPVAYNILKLQISCVVEDDKVSIDWLTEQIQEIEDYVQSVDIAAFNKI